MTDLFRDLALALDPVRLFEASGRTADPWQAALLRSASRRQLLLCARQTGKSSTVATLALHEAIFNAPALVLLLSPSLRQSGELFRKVLDLYRVAASGSPVEDESSLRLELKNGSRIISLPGEESTIRGFSGVRLLILDEAARIEDELYHAVRPMLAVSAGRLVALSTPRGKRGWFHAAWTEGGPTWERTLVRASDCPRISSSFLEEERRAIGEFAFGQEYLVEFLDCESQYFATDDIARMVDPSIRPLFPGPPPFAETTPVVFFDADIKPLEVK